MKELPMGTKNKGGYPVGLQIKVSRNKDHIVNSLKHSQYGVPVVYFDLKRDFNQAAQKLHEEALYFGERNWELGVDLICGRDVSPELHDNLLQFLPLLDRLLEGKMELGDLLEEIPEIDTAVKSRFIETTGIGVKSYTQERLEIITLPIIK